MKLAIALVFGMGCAGGSPLVESGPQVELTTNPGGVVGQPALQLTLTSWVNLAALRDATESGQLEATLDGEALVIDQGGTGDFDNGDHYTAMFVLAPDSLRSSSSATSSTVTVTDQQTTWSVQVRDLFTNDLQPLGPVAANQSATLVWPSAATTEPWSTIDWVCIDVADRAAACQSDEVHDPGIDIANEYVQIDLPAQTGEQLVTWGQRWVHPVASGDGPIFLTSILARWTGTFQ